MRRASKALLSLVGVGCVAAVAGAGTWSAFSSTTASTGDSFAAGTVQLSDNDAGSALLSLSSAMPGASSTGCVLVTYGGTLDADLRLYASVTGDLAPYLTLTVTRGTDSAPSFSSCAAFTPDATNYVGAGPGVVYSGPLSGYRDVVRGRRRRPHLGSARDVVLVREPQLQAPDRARQRPCRREPLFHRHVHVGGEVPVTRLIGRALRLVGLALAGALAVVVGASIAADYRWRIRHRLETDAPGPAVAGRPATPPASATPPGSRLATHTAAGAASARRPPAQGRGAAANEPAPPAARGPGLRALVRRSALFAGWTAAGLALALLLALGGSFLAGYRSMTVMSGSMEPAIATGDVVVNRPMAPLEARVGDVITFRDPGDASRFITHRVRHIRARDGKVTFVTKGDANTATERWTVPVDGEIGRVDYRLPRLGFALFWTSGRYAKLALITLPALLLGAITLGRIWGLRRRDLSGGLTA